MKCLENIVGVKRVVLRDNNYRYEYSRERYYLVVLQIKHPILVLPIYLKPTGHSLGVWFWVFVGGGVFSCCLFGGGGVFVCLFVCFLLSLLFCFCFCYCLLFVCLFDLFFVPCFLVLKHAFHSWCYEVYDICEITSLIS